MVTAKKPSSKPAVAKTAATAKAAAKPRPKTAASTPKVAAAKTGASKSVAKQSPKSKASAGNKVPPAQRAHYIEVAAFYIAERRGFAPGDPLQDWITAEAEIDRLLAEGRLG